MNNPIGQYSLQVVLDAYIAAIAKPSRETLAEWVKRYPQYADELAEFTMAWIQSEFSTEVEEKTEISNRRIQIGMDMARKVYEQRPVEDVKQSSQVNSQLDSLLQTASFVGLSPDQFKDECNLSMAMMRRIENRLILVESIPLDLIQRIAQTLHQSAQDILTYLNRQPIIPAGLRFTSHQPPKINQRENFFDALRKDDTLGEDQFTYWLSFEDKNK
ncbi:MAG: hypothetical protein A2X25_12905 [Chloroflexi bacterium GWB2_49_20]|nr:MAG: hypothetical protein A2X25_12905 [Chloroflexi bacterium GWB2_49_20]OGN78382.1 MAG: hypothetical protein A2X26_01295 [Chloroflexi bacterium GWC2_49_37]OGN84155.1 MAG: hypothetical protein A2X27_14395 [Chloroflexi bacterium GWD2_49_16]HBG75195.1 hypothetical protein [Anaerolineae bacterium]HCC79170.1 hypothetical protein [Anaerolineae bacterium]